jgi:hypothetical protein
MTECRTEYTSWPLTQAQYANAFTWVWRPDERFCADVPGLAYEETQTVPPWRWLGCRPRGFDE